jgi:hypothetical protein
MNKHVIYYNSYIINNIMNNIMNNIEIIEIIEIIVSPYFTFNMDDFYGDRGSYEYPKIEDISTLFFKLNGKDRNLSISKNKQQEMVDKIKNINIGTVEISTVSSFGRYIVIKPYKN